VPKAVILILPFLVAALDYEKKSVTKLMEASSSTWYLKAMIKATRFKQQSQAGRKAKGGSGQAGVGRKTECLILPVLEI
jgi:hypothetical protein